jgi:hypothetical protein
MSFQFEWQVGSEDGQWETIAQTRRRPRRKWPWWVWSILIAILLSSATAGYVIVRRRYDEARRQLEFQIQSVIDLETRAFAQNDKDLFLAQQDIASPDWYAAQATRINPDCLRLLSSRIRTANQIPQRIPRERCAPVLPAQIQDLNLQGDIARVHVIEDQPPVRRVRFYRQTNAGWRHTAPQIEFWKAAVELTYGNTVFLYHQRDDPPVDPLIEHIYQAFNSVCQRLGCPAESTLQVNFVVDLASPYLEDGTLLLASPWLSGIPISDNWDEAYLDELAFWAAYEATSQFLRSGSGRPLNQLQQAIAIEYAAWYSYQDPEQVPILSHVIERRGTALLVPALRSLRSMRTLSAFIATWILLSPTDQERAFFQTLLNIEREAILAGRKESFLLLQDNVGFWSRQQEIFYDQVQSYNAPISLPTAQVQTVERIEDRARVVLKEQAWQSPIQGYAFYRLRNGDWKHTSPFGAGIWTSTPTPTPVPSPTPTLAPTSNQSS